MAKIGSFRHQYCSFGTVVLWFLFCPVALEAQKFLPDDPILEDEDNLPGPKPAYVELSPTYDMLQNTLRGNACAQWVRAQNINTLGEVPNSTWFTNRIGAGDLTTDELLRGARPDDGPDAKGSLTVTGAALMAHREGLYIRDSLGHRFYISFDPKGLPSLATAADVIATTFLHASGYHVLSACISFIDPERLQIDPSAKVLLMGQNQAPLDRSYLNLTLERSEQGPDGLYRVVAHRLHEGETLGGFRFHGVRSDDLNDIFAHENRRELRGLRVFSAWLNHYRCSSIHSMDVYVGEEGKGHTRHFLIDFSSALGSGHDFSGRITAKEAKAGNESGVPGDSGAIAKTAITLGVWERPWKRIDYPYPKYREIGKIEADHFEPQNWKPDYRNAAFDCMLPDDAFWAARIISRFSDQQIREIVSMGRFVDPEAEQYLSDILIRRRDKILAYYFGQINPLADFEVRDGNLEFRNLGVDFGVSPKATYRYRWFRFDNVQSQLTPITPQRYTGFNFASLPRETPVYLVVRINSVANDLDKWAYDVDVYLRRNAEEYQIVGIEREVGFEVLETPQ
jgi:hypothetical protein